MAIHKASNQIGKVYKGSNQIGKVYKGSTLIYTAEETFTKSVTSGETGRDESYGEWGAIHIELPAGETFRIDNITFDQRIYTNIDCDLFVNGEEVWDYNRTVGEYYTQNTGVIGTYTAQSGKTAIMLRIRGWDSNTSWYGTFYNTATITYTTGV